jgi:hypothetical protein
MPTEYSRNFGLVQKSDLPQGERRGGQRRRKESKKKEQPRRTTGTPVLKALLDAGIVPEKGDADA